MPRKRPHSNSKLFWGSILGLSLVFIILGAIVLYSSLSRITSPEIGIIDIYKPISTVPSDTLFSKTISSERIIRELKEAENNPNIKVIFLDIDSPGGSVVASKAVAYAVHNSTKPVVAYINDIGTSGAYYIASAANLVIADEDSLTGSIGVIMELDNYAGLMRKLGVNVTVIKEGQFKDIGNPARKMTPQEKQILQNITYLAYQHFKRDILKFRGNKLKAPIDSFADGRPLSGYQAWKLGLVDELGTRQFALEQAWKLANQTGEPRTVNLSEQKVSLLDLLLSSISQIAPASYSSVKMDARF